MEAIPETVNTPCCLLHRVYISHPDRALLMRVCNIARARHRWRCRIIAFPPNWHVYIAEEDLSKAQVAAVQRQQGPVVVLAKILKELMAHDGI